MNYFPEFDEIKKLELESKAEARALEQQEMDNMSLYQKIKQFSFSSETLYSSCEKLESLEHVPDDALADLDNVRSIAEQNNNSFYQQSLGRLRNYGANMLKGYKDPVDSMLMSKSNVVTESVTLIARNIFNLYVNEQYM